MVEPPGCGSATAFIAKAPCAPWRCIPVTLVSCTVARTAACTAARTAERWERLDSPMNEIPIWALAIDPVDPNIIFAGPRPAALFRSTDGGQHWDKLSVQIAEECPNVGIPLAHQAKFLTCSHSIKPRARP